MIPLYTILEAFCDCVNIPLTMFDEKNKITKEFFPEKKICSLFTSTYNCGGECGNTMLFSAKMSSQLGEAYVFSCPCDFAHIAVPILEQGKTNGCVIAGPIMMGGIADNQLRKMFSMNTFDGALFSEVVKMLQQMQVFTPERVYSASLLLFGAVSSCCEPSEYAAIRSTQQGNRQGSEIIRRLKQERSPLLADEVKDRTILELIDHCIRGNVGGISAAADRVIDTLVVAEGGQFDMVRIRILELYLTLVKTSIEYGTPMNRIFEPGYDPVQTLSGIFTINELKIFTTHMATHFAENVFPSSRPSRTMLVQETLRIIEEQYMTKLTLQEIARDLYTSDSNISRLFKKELGISFTDYLSEIRIRHSMELLRETDMSILQIAMLVGFEEQSYFTKIFKKVTGKTPRQYRQALENNASIDHPDHDSFEK